MAFRVLQAGLAVAAAGFAWSAASLFASFGPSAFAFARAAAAAGLLAAAARPSWLRGGAAAAGASFALLVPYALVLHGVDLFLAADAGVATGLLLGAVSAEAPGRRLGLAVGAAGAGLFAVLFATQGLLAEAGAAATATAGMGLASWGSEAA